MAKVTKKTLVDYIMAFESGTLEKNDIIKLFQYLIDHKLLAGLQGSYGRTANALIEKGYCHV